MSDSIWTRVDGHYVAKGHRVVGLIMQNGEVWQSQVMIDGKTVDLGEWDGLNQAIGNTTSGMSRACWLRRFEKDPPTMPDDPEDDEDDEEDD